VGTFTGHLKLHRSLQQLERGCEGRIGGGRGLWWTGLRQQWTPGGQKRKELETDRAANGTPDPGNAHHAHWELFAHPESRHGSHTKRAVARSSRGATNAPTRSRGELALFGGRPGAAALTNHAVVITKVQPSFCGSKCLCPTHLHLRRYAICDQPMDIVSSESGEALSMLLGRSRLLCRLRVRITDSC
jgi:hypothetical protein